MSYTELPNTLPSCEWLKFYLDENGNVVVRTSATGTFSMTGLNQGGLCTEVELVDTEWRPLPPVALTYRNAIAIQNFSGIEIKVNHSSSVVGYKGSRVTNQGERFYDVKNGIKLYGRSSAGTVIVDVEEIG